MKQEERDLSQDESVGRETDTTRTERRQTVSDDQVTNNDNVAEGANGTPGGHQEGQYSKQSNKPEVNK